DDIGNQAPLGPQAAAQGSDHEGCFKGVDGADLELVGQSRAGCFIQRNLEVPTCRRHAVDADDGVEKWGLGGAHAAAANVSAPRIIVSESRPARARSSASR